jgi:hypothetical protein
VREDIVTLSEQPPRKLRRVDLTERSTLRGLTTGIVRLRSDEALLPCVVFGGGFSSWLPVLRELGYRAILVLLRDEKHLEAVEDLVEGKCAVWCGLDWGVFGAAMPSFGVTRNMMWFVDGRVTDELRRMSKKWGSKQLLFVKRRIVQVPLSLWEEHLINDGACTWTKRERRKLGPACDALRKRLLFCWKKKVSAGFRTWLNEKYVDTFKIINETWGSGVKFDNGRYVWRDGQAGRDDYSSWWSARMLACPEDLMAGMDAIGRAFRVTWWEWDDGSRPFHWRWPKEYQERMRDGLKVHFRTEAPRYVVPQRDVRDPGTKKKVIEKLLQKVRI